MAWASQSCAGMGGKGREAVFDGHYFCICYDEKDEKVLLCNSICILEDV
jgi:hypothetical protein